MRAEIIKLVVAETTLANIIKEREDKMKDINIISEHKSKYKKHPKQSPVAKGKKRVMAIVDGKTRHLDIAE